MMSMNPGAGYPVSLHEQNGSTGAPSQVGDPSMGKTRRELVADMADADKRAIATLDAKIRACLVPGLCAKRLSSSE